MGSPSAGTHLAVSGCALLRDLVRAVTGGEEAGLVKLVVEDGTGRLLGGHVLAARGGDLLGELALAVRLGLPSDAIAAPLHPYPTFSEGVFWAARHLRAGDAGDVAGEGVARPAEA